MKASRTFVVCALAGVMAFGTSMLAGCGGKGTNTVSITYLYATALPKDFQKVEDAINEHIKDSGIQIEFYPTSLTAVNQYSTTLQSGDMDVICMAWTSPYELAELHAIETLTEEQLQEYAPGVVELNEDYPMYVRNARGEIISIATREEAVASGGSLMIRKADLGKCGLAETYPDQTEIDYDDLRTIFAALKNNETIKSEVGTNYYPLASIRDDSGFFIARDLCGVQDVTASSGVLNLQADPATTTVVNYYETQEYKNFVAFMKECQEKGWLSPEADTTNELSTDMFKTGKARSMFQDCQQGLRNAQTNALKEEVVQLQIIKPYYAFDNSQISWGVCSLADNVGACLKAIDLMMTDKEVINMLYWGLEGEHYKFVNEENGFIDYADGLDINTTPYRNGIGVYGDKRMVYSYVTEGSSWEADLATKNADIAAADKAFAERCSKANGFVYDSSKMTAKLANITNVVSKYAKTIATGKGSTAYYDEFIRELKNAGIGDVIADKQAQLNAWLANNG